jgi:hypothetical protein
MEYLAKLVMLAQQRAPDAARELLERAEALEATRQMVSTRPSGRPD